MNNTTNGTIGGKMTMMHPHHKMMMMHMTFYWGKNAEILFSGWPGMSTEMYILSLVFVFVMCFLIEWLSHSQLINPGSTNLAAGLIQSLLHALRVGLANLAMLALMSFNGGVFLVAMAGHTLGFLIFGSRAFKKSPPLLANAYDLPPISTCC